MDNIHPTDKKPFRACTYGVWRWLPGNYNRIYTHCYAVTLLSHQIQYVVSPTTWQPTYCDVVVVSTAYARQKTALFIKIASRSPDCCSSHHDPQISTSTPSASLDTKKKEKEKKSSKNITLHYTTFPSCLPCISPCIDNKFPRMNWVPPTLTQHLCSTGKSRMETAHREIYYPISY